LCVEKGKGGNPGEGRNVILDVSFGSWEGGGGGGRRGKDSVPAALYFSHGKKKGAPADVERKRKKGGKKGRGHSDLSIPQSSGKKSRGPS